LVSIFSVTLHFFAKSRSVDAIAEESLKGKLHILLSTHILDTASFMMAPRQSLTLTDLAAQISAHAKSMSDLLAEANMPAPSFAPDAPPSVPLEPEYEKIQMARMALIGAAQAIRDLALGPDDYIKLMSFSVRKSNNRTHRKTS
jgi:hypothetical protein